MKVILLKDIAKVGRKYDVKDVSDGYALNSLIPKGAAKTATADAMKKLEILKKAQEGERKVQEDILAKNIHELEGKTVEIKARANDKGHLFAGIHIEDLPAYIKESTGSVIDPHFIEMERAIKEVGEYEVKVKAGDKHATLKISVEAK